MRLPIAAITAVALAGAAPAQVARPTFADPLLKLDLTQRNGVLRRAVTQNGLRCGRLDQSGYRGFYRNLSFWVATCTPGGRYGIFVGQDQSVQVRRCEEMAGLKLPACDPRPAAKRTR